MSASGLSISGIDGLPLVLALAGCAVSSYTDIRYGKIKNWVTFPLILFGWGWAAAQGWACLAGSVLAAVALAPTVCAAGRFGPGDVKLIAGVAANLAAVKFVLAPLFVAGLFMCLAVAAVAVRLAVHGFKPRAAVAAMKAEAAMELAGDREAHRVHGNVRHAGAPAILAALVLCLVVARVRGVL